MSGGGVGGVVSINMEASMVGTQVSRTLTKKSSEVILGSE